MKVLNTVKLKAKSSLEFFLREMKLCNGGTQMGGGDTANLVLCLINNGNCCIHSPHPSRLKMSLLLIDGAI